MHVSSDKKTRVSEVESDLDLKPNREESSTWSVNLTQFKTTYIYLSTKNSHTSKIEQLVETIITI